MKCWARNFSRNFILSPIPTVPSTIIRQSMKIRSTSNFKYENKTSFSCYHFNCSSSWSTYPGETMPRIVTARFQFTRSDLCDPPVQWCGTLAGLIKIDRLCIGFALDSPKYRTESWFLDRESINRVIDTNCSSWLVLFFTLIAWKRHTRIKTDDCTSKYCSNLV